MNIIKVKNDNVSDLRNVLLIGDTIIRAQEISIPEYLEPVLSESEVAFFHLREGNLDEVIKEELEKKYETKFEVESNYKDSYLAIKTKDDKVAPVLAEAIFGEREECMKYNYVNECI